MENYFFLNVLGQGEFLEGGTQVALPASRHWREHGVFPQILFQAPKPGAPPPRPCVSLIENSMPSTANVN